jgi:hypothetical protein
MNAIQPTPAHTSPAASQTVESIENLAQLRCIVADFKLLE